MPMRKPTVYYTDAAAKPVLGESACVLVLRHPRFPMSTWLRTSPVVRLDGERFETLNTIYAPGRRDFDLKSDALTVRGWVSEYNKSQLVTVGAVHGASYGQDTGALL